MARVDPRVLDDAVAAAEARVAAAREERTRQEAVVSRDTVLVENDALSRQAFEASRAQLEAAKAALVAAERALASARTLRSFADVPAPWSGVVSARLVEPGDLAAPGKPLYTVQVPGPVKVVSKLSQESLALPFAGRPRRLRERRRDARGTDLEDLPRPRRLAPRHGRDGPSLRALLGLAPGATVSATYAGDLVRRRVSSSRPRPSSRESTETLVVRVRDGKADPVPVIGRRAATAATQPFAATSPPETSSSPGCRAS